MMEISQWYFFETLECLVILLAFEKSKSIIENNFVCLLRCCCTKVFIWIDLCILLNVRIWKEFVVGFVQKLDCFRKVVNCHIVLFELHMDNAEVVEIILRMCLVALLVDHIILWDFIFSFLLVAYLMSLKFKACATSNSIFFIDP